MRHDGAEARKHGGTNSALRAFAPSRVRACSFDLSRLRTSIKPFRLHWFPRLRSTNDHAAVLRERCTLYAPAIVLTGRQTAGRGRGLHGWWSSTGCLTVTFVMPLDNAVQPYQVPLIAGIAVRRAVQKLLQGTCGIGLKWPNDLLHNGRKLGGLLCERVRQVDLIGLGLNVNLAPEEAPEDLRRRVTSMSAIVGQPVDVTTTLATLAAELHQIFRNLPETPFTALLGEYANHHTLFGKQVTVLEGSDGKPIRGRCEGVDAVGRLLIRDRATLHRIISGQVSSWR